MKLIFPTNNVVTSPESPPELEGLYPPGAYPENSTLIVLPSKDVSLVSFKAFNAFSWFSYSTNALPFKILHFVKVPNGSNNSLRLLSSVLKESP